MPIPIVIPTYNRAARLVRALRSVVAAVDADDVFLLFGG